MPRQTLAELLASPPAPLRTTTRPLPYLILDGIEGEPPLFEEETDEFTQKKMTALDSHRSGLIDDEIG